LTHEKSGIAEAARWSGTVLKDDSPRERCEQKNKKSDGRAAPQIAGLGRHRLRLYDDPVRQALLVLWEASDRVCSKRLKALLPVLVIALERHERLSLDSAVRCRLTRISAATIDRLLAKERAAGLKGRPKHSPMIPRCRGFISVFPNARPLAPGYAYLQIWRDSTKGHECGLSLTDVFSGWTERGPLAAREVPLILQSLSELSKRLPFTLRALAISPDLEFSGPALERYCHALGLEFARSPRRDDARLVSASHSADFARVDDGATLEPLAQLCVVTSLYMNFFQASFRIEGQRAPDGRTAKSVHTLGTPCMRLLLSNELSEQQKAQLNSQCALLDPIELLDVARRMRSHLALLAAGFRVHPPPGVRHWRTHPDAFETAWPAVEEWLRADPNQSGKAIFERLRAEFPGVYREGQLRSLQRRVKEWRSKWEARA
jgi:hypothetical protein